MLVFFENHWTYCNFLFLDTSIVAFPRLRDHLTVITHEILPSCSAVCRVYFGYVSHETLPSCIYIFYVVSSCFLTIFHVVPYFCILRGYSLVFLMTSVVMNLHMPMIIKLCSLMTFNRHASLSISIFFHLLLNIYLLHDILRVILLEQDVLFISFE